MLHCIVQCVQVLENMENSQCGHGIEKPCNKVFLYYILFVWGFHTYTCRLQDCKFWLIQCSWHSWTVSNEGSLEWHTYTVTWDLLLYGHLRGLMTLLPVAEHLAVGFCFNRDRWRNLKSWQINIIIRNYVIQTSKPKLNYSWRKSFPAQFKGHRCRTWAQIQPFTSKITYISI